MNALAEHTVCAFIEDMRGGLESAERAFGARATDEPGAQTGAKFSPLPEHAPPRRRGRRRAARALALNRRRPEAHRPCYVRVYLHPGTRGRQHLEVRLNVRIDGVAQSAPCPPLHN